MSPYLLYFCYKIVVSQSQSEDKISNFNYFAVWMGFYCFLHQGMKLELDVFKITD